MVPGILQCVLCMVTLPCLAMKTTTGVAGRRTEADVTAVVDTGGRPRTHRQETHFFPNRQQIRTIRL